MPSPSNQTAGRANALALPFAAAGGVALILLIGLASGPSGHPAATGSSGPSYAAGQPAPPIELTASDGSHFSLAARRGTPQLVFFGYTHCTDVCPMTIGTVGTALAKFTPGAQAVFVTIDPERDTVAWLADYARYTPAGFTFVTGSPTEIATTAQAWNVRYARQDADSSGDYDMSHTDDVFVVDAAGDLRAHLPFGTNVAGFDAALATAAVTASVPSAAPSAVPTAVPLTPAATARKSDVTAQVLSGSVWAGGGSPLIFGLSDAGGRVDDLHAEVGLQLVGSDGSRTGGAFPAIAVQPPGETKVWYVATVDIAAPGPVTFEVAGTAKSQPVDTTLRVNALDPGVTTPLGAPAPAAHTPTLADVGGDLALISTDPGPDPRLYTTSTTDALAQHLPFVLVVDSARFKVTSACGKALAMARYLVDRWPAIPFIHLEPYAYTIVTEEPVITGSLDAPVEVPAATAWGVAGPPWGAKSMPWIFIVDGNGAVRAKYQGVIGTDEVDVMVSLLTNR